VGRGTSRARKPGPDGPDGEGEVGGEAGVVDERVPGAVARDQEGHEQRARQRHEEDPQVLREGDEAAVGAQLVAHAHDA
jgi:hypothetical protein